RHERLWGSVHDASGAESRFDLFVDTAAARARPVLNEVLADALGPEPQSEWIELVNDGSLALDLSGYSLQDSGGLTPLPAQVLAPEEYALLVRNDFTPNASDVPPAPGAHLIRLPNLGKSGLSNAGERLALQDSAGQECSALPALPAKPGQSLARLHLWSLDGDVSAFSFGTPTPGAPNDAAK
ncbi:MAG TPA: lamin tail domain-containing protein, partial [Polyangiaceae bacterium]